MVNVFWLDPTLKIYIKQFLLGHYLSSDCTPDYHRSIFVNKLKSSRQKKKIVIKPSSRDIHLTKISCFSFAISNWITYHGEQNMHCYGSFTWIEPFDSTSWVCKTITPTSQWVPYHIPHSHTWSTNSFHAINLEHTSTKHELHCSSPSQHWRPST